MACYMNLNDSVVFVYMLMKNYDCSWLVISAIGRLGYAKRFGFGYCLELPEYS